MGLYETTNWGLYESGDDPEVYITDKGTCSSCGEPIDLDDLSNLDFHVEESGVQPGTQYGPAVHWANGTIACPNCGERLPYKASE